MTRGKTKRYSINFENVFGVKERRPRKRKESVKIKFNFDLLKDYKKMRKKPLTIAINEEVLNNFKTLCDRQGYTISRRMEVLMIRDIEEDKD